MGLILNLARGQSVTLTASTAFLKLSQFTSLKILSKFKVLGGSNSTVTTKLFAVNFSLKSINLFLPFFALAQMTSFIFKKEQRMPFYREISLDFSFALLTALRRAPLIPPSSNSINPSTVTPAGVVTSPFNKAGCSPVFNNILAAPNKDWAVDF